VDWVWCGKCGRNEARFAGAIVKADSRWEWKEESEKQRAKSEKRKADSSAPLRNDNKKSCGMKTKELWNDNKRAAD
jgi:hypothetical protein